MVLPTTQSFAEIAASVEITEARNVLYGGQNLMRMPDGALPPNVSENTLRQTLHNLVYQVFYCRDTRPALLHPLEFVFPEVKDRVDFLKKLRASNTSRERWDKDWRIETIDQWGGGMWVTKSGWRRMAAPGDFIREKPHQPMEEGTSVRFFVRSESEPGPEDGFYFLFGNTLGDDNPSQTTRFYFHLQPEGAPGLVGLLSIHFNAFQIPFQFKCLADPAAYHRCDSAVLYVDKRYAQICSEVLAGLVYPEIQAALQEGEPAWTLPLAKGTGFAENPPNPAESFGMNRSRLIVQGIMNAFQNQMPKNQWAAAIEAEFTQRNFNLDRLYLNPFSHFPYNFDAWKICQ